MTNRRSPAFAILIWLFLVAALLAATVVGCALAPMRGAAVLPQRGTAEPTAAAAVADPTLHLVEASPTVAVGLTPTSTATATPQASPAPAATPTRGPITTHPDLEVAFIADSGYGRDFERVLRLIQAEGADLVVHPGDFDYYEDPAGFEAAINRVLGPDFPYFLAVGNHDVDSWNADCRNRRGCYARFLGERLARIGAEPDEPNLDDQMYAVTYRGLKMVFVGQNGSRAGDEVYAPFLERQLSGDDHVWRVAVWHKNQSAMQVGGKGDDMGWKVYETARERGAIVATGHEHSYSRTRTLSGMRNSTVDAQWPDPNRLRVGSGSTFAFVSGLGGHSIRPQLRCRPTTFPYGCKQEWASIYTTDQRAAFGALFITFHVDGDPRKARGYFRNVDGRVVDAFEVFREP